MSRFANNVYIGERFPRGGQPIPPGRTRGRAGVVVAPVGGGRAYDGYAAATRQWARKGRCRARRTDAVTGGGRTRRRCRGGESSAQGIEVRGDRARVGFAAALARWRVAGGTVANGRELADALMARDRARARLCAQGLAGKVAAGERAKWILVRRNGY